MLKLGKKRKCSCCGPVRFSRLCKKHYIISNHEIVHSCYLLTYFFITGILTVLETDLGDSEINEKATTFVHRFGAYLKLHACLVAAASCKAENVIKVLLDLAQHDPRHKDVAKHIARMGSLVLYEEVSASIAPNDSNIHFILTVFCSRCSLRFWNAFRPYKRKS